MNALEVVRLAAQRGINLTVDGDKLLAKPLLAIRGMPAELVSMIRDNKSAIVEILLEPLPHGDCARCGGDTENRLPPMPKSVRACLDFVERTHGKRELTAGLRGWLDKEWSRIERYERAMEVDYDRKTAS